MLEAAADLIVAGTLADYTAFAGVRSVAESAGVRPGTVSYHFPAKEGGGRNRKLANEAMDHALNRAGFEVTERTVTALRAAAKGVSAGDQEALYQVAKAAADNIIGSSSGEALADDTASWLAVAAAANDPTACRLLSERDEGSHRLLEPVYRELAEAAGRRFIRDISVREFATAVACLADGFVARRRFAPGEASPDLFARMAVALFQAVTVPETVADEPSIGEGLIPPSSGANLDQRKRNAIAQAAVDLYQRRSDWRDVTISLVAERAKVSRATVTANFSDRNGLAAVIWSRWVPKLETYLQTEAETSPFEVVLRGYFREVAQLTANHRALTGAMLVAVFAFSVEHGVPDYRNPSDPRTVLPLPQLLVPLLLENKERLQQGLVTDKVSALSFSAFLHNTLILMALTRQGLTERTGPTEMTSTDAAEYAMRIVLDGALAS